MTSVSTTADPIPSPSQVSVRAARFGATAATHTVVDFFSALLIPIMSVLEGRLEMSHAQGAIILSVGSLCSGLVQPLIAWLSDRFDTRLLGPIAFAIAVVAISLVGHARTFEHLLVIQIVGTLGIGAFHPVAAAAVGQLSGRRRSLGVSIFFCAGMLGSVSGHLTSPRLAGRFGLESYVWLIIPGLLAACGLTWAVARVAHRNHDAHTQRASWAPGEAGARWRAVGLLYVGNVLRFTVNMMLVQLLIRWSEQSALAHVPETTLDAGVREAASMINGPMQAAMQLGMAVGGLAAGAFLRRHHEKGALVVVPLVGAVAIGAFPFVGAPWAPFALIFCAGVGFAGMVPVTIALGQRLLPHRTGLASGLMMGGAWGVAAIGPPLAQWIDRSRGLTTAFVATGLLLLVAGLLSTALPSRLMAKISPH
ncbi:MAG: MFS transporter [Phycisphaerales bacterium]|nr:MFS transporter [Phycisphaerales bacterium]